MTVYVTDTAEVESVQLADTWKTSVDPRTLQTSVVSAANAATMQALAKELEAKRAESVGLGTEQGNCSRAFGPVEGAPLSKSDVNRLLDAVSSDLERFTQQVNELVGQPTSCCSSGGHVQGTAQRGQILSISIDGGWASTARKPEIESELVDLLKSLQSENSVGNLANGPQSPAALITAAITALNSHLDTIESEQNLLKQKVHDLGDTWMKSETDMTDASVSDGDESDWRINQ